MSEFFAHGENSMRPWKALLFDAKRAYAPKAPPKTVDELKAQIMGNTCLLTFARKTIRSVTRAF